MPPVREKLLKKLAKEFCNDFLKILYKVAGEDDCVEILYKTLFYIFPRGSMKSASAPPRGGAREPGSCIGVPSGSCQ